MINTIALVFFCSVAVIFGMMSILTASINFLRREYCKTIDVKDIARENKVYIVSCCLMVLGMGIKFFHG